MKLLSTTALALTLSLGGCSGSRVGDLISAATTTITNPVDATSIYSIKSGYAVGLELGVAYREFCWARPYAALMKDPIAKPLCQKRRSVVRGMQAAQLWAADRISEAEVFVRDNPTLNATVVLAAALNSVRNMQNATPRVN